MAAILQRAELTAYCFSVSCECLIDVCRMFERSDTKKVNRQLRLLCLFDNENLSNKGLPHIIPVIIKMPVRLKAAVCIHVQYVCITFTVIWGKKITVPWHPLYSCPIIKVYRKIFIFSNCFILVRDITRQLRLGCWAVTGGLSTCFLLGMSLSLHLE